MALWKSAIICENPQIFVAQVHKYFCFLRHSFGPSPDVYNNVLPLDLPTVYCPELERGSFKEASWNFYPLDTLFVRVHFQHFLPTRTKLKCTFLTKTCFKKISTHSINNVSVTNIFLVTTILNVNHSSDIIDSMRNHTAWLKMSYCAI